MSGLCGWTRVCADRGRDGSVAAAMGASAHATRSERCDHGAVGGRRVGRDETSRRSAPVRARRVARCAVSGRLWIDGKAVQDPARALAEAFAEQGTNVMSRLSGNFVLAVAKGDEVLLATDRLGRRPLVYCQRGEVLVVRLERRGVASASGRAFSDRRAVDLRVLLFSSSPRAAHDPQGPQASAAGRVPALCERPRQDRDLVAAAVRAR